MDGFAEQLRLTGDIDLILDFEIACFILNKQRYADA
jgi:hypothetical protein